MGLRFRGIDDGARKACDFERMRCVLVCEVHGGDYKGGHSNYLLPSNYMGLLGMLLGVTLVLCWIWKCLISFCDVQTNVGELSL